MMELRLHKGSRLAVALLTIILAAISSNSQTSAELRSKYGEPQMSKIKNGRTELERYLVRPNIVMTIYYTKNGRPRDAMIQPLKGTRSKDDTSQHPPQGDYMSTADVIDIINEIVPIERRGKRFGDGTMNGGDPLMKLNHPGCSGGYDAYYENVSFYCSTWCWGGTLYANIVWGKSPLFHAMYGGQQGRPMKKKHRAR